ncbi:MAG: lysostaphin resistance A-like protein [Gemmatimonadota bacterium]
MEPNLILQGYALLLLLGLPALAARDAGRVSGVERAAEFRRPIYISIAFSLFLIAAVTFAIARWQGLSGEAVGWRAVPAGRALGWATGVALTGLFMAWALTLMGQRFGLSEGRLAHLLMPRNAREKRAFLVLAGIGALCEEYVYRGFLLHVVTGWSGNVWVGVGVTSASFGLAHGYQKLLGALRATLLGLLMALPVVFTGSLLPAIEAHFWINAVIGLGAWRWLIAVREEESA